MGIQDYDNYTLGAGCMAMRKVPKSEDVVTDTDEGRAERDASLMYDTRDRAIPKSPTEREVDTVIRNKQKQERYAMMYDSGADKMAASVKGARQARDASLEQGTKLDEGKLRFDLLPADSTTEIVKVLTYGATKYADRNWEKGIKYSRVYGALLRHLFAWWRGQVYDAETGYHHLAHAGCCVMFLLSYEMRALALDQATYEKFDDRSTNESSIEGTQQWQMIPKSPS